MRILLTNDDGYHAPGMAVLEAIGRQLSDDIWVCAPAEERDLLPAYEDGRRIHAVEQAVASAESALNSAISRINNREDKLEAKQRELRQDGLTDEERKQEAEEARLRKEAKAREIAEAKARFDVIDARCVHRVGTLVIGDLAVWVCVSAAHRGAAFDACRYIIDETKRRVPIWKREHYREGDADWLHPMAEEA